SANDAVTAWKTSRKAQTMRQGAVVDFIFILSSKCFVVRAIWLDCDKAVGGPLWYVRTASALRIIIFTARKVSRLNLTRWLRREPWRHVFRDAQHALLPIHRLLKSLVVSKCPFANLPETHKGRWGDGLTAADMDKCVWVKPEIVARIEFLEWTESDHLRHSKFAGLREDKDARSVVKEHAGE